MKSDLPKAFKEGDELTASLIDNILGEIWRWRALEGVPPIHISEVDSKFGPPVISFSAGTIEGQFVPGTTGTTGGGFAAGTPASPAKPTSSVVIYGYETSTSITTGTSAGIYGGWPSANSQTIYSTATSGPMAFNIYANTISANLTAWYWKSPNTGNYYIITVDCP